MDQENSHLAQAAKSVIFAASAAGLSIITIESCTAGRLASLLADAPGAGDVLEGGFVTYTKDQKSALGIAREIIDRDGAVSESVAKLMTEVALRLSPADIALSITGVAGPERDEDGNQVGLVFLGLRRREEPGIVKRYDFGEIERTIFMQKTLSHALMMLADSIAGNTAPR